MLQIDTKNVYQTTYTKYIYSISKNTNKHYTEKCVKKRLYTLIDLFHAAQECFVLRSNAHRKERNSFNFDTQPSIH